MRLKKTVLRNGMSLWYRSDDRYVGQRVALGKYEEFETEIIRRQAHNSTVVVDVGANIGYYTLLLAGLAKKVYAIEPDDECYEILKKNVEENNLKNVVLLNVAASDKKEKRAMIKDKRNLGNSRLSDKRATIKEKRYRVSCQGLDEILQNEQKIDLIKIDVQGWEERVIEGGKKTIRRDSPIIFLEYNQGNNIDFLKSIYKYIWSIDYWLYIYRRGVHINKKTGYVDLWMKKEAGWREWWEGWRRVAIKKLVKAIMRYE